MDQRLTGLEQDALQPRLAMETDMPADKKTRQRTEGGAKAVRAMHGETFSAKGIHDGPKRSITFGENVEPPALSCRGGVVIENGTAAPKSCLSPLEMRTTTAAGGLLPNGKTFTATWTTFDQPTLWFRLAEEKKLRTSVLYAWYYSSFWRNNLLAASSCRRVIETKSGQNRMFDPGGFTGHLCACPCWGTWGALFCGKIMR